MATDSIHGQKIKIIEGISMIVLKHGATMQFLVMFFCELCMLQSRCEQLLPKQEAKQQNFSEQQQSSKRQITIIREVITKNNNNDQLSIAERLNRIDDQQQFKNEFLKLDTRNKLQYVMSLKTNEYEQFLKRFKNETEWKEFWNKLSVDDRSHVPSTLESQYRLLRDCYYTYSEKSLYESFYPTVKNNPPTDIDYWRVTYYEQSSDFLGNFPETRSIFLEDLFYRQKLTLFRVVRLD
jgi:biopolymer transport protein ExbD